MREPLQKSSMMIHPICAKPVFKYIGGKTWLSDELNKRIDVVLKNNNISMYSEPFAGGLGAFLAIQEKLSKHKIENVYLSDINTHIVLLYQQIQRKPQNIIAEVKKIESEFIKMLPSQVDSNKSTKEELIHCEMFFKSQRELFNIEKQNIKNYKLNSKKLISQCARLIFLQRHSFNGIYRENASGNYNSPFNWSAKSSSDFEENIKNLYFVFSKFNLEFANESFETSIIKQNKDKCLLYLDPPYINPESSISAGAENKYSKSGFGIKEQKLLINLISEYNFIYSNHYDKYIIKDLKDVTKGKGKLKIDSIGRRNIMSAKADNRQQLIEEALAVFVKKTS